MDYRTWACSGGGRRIERISSNQSEAFVLDSANSIPGFHLDHRGRLRNASQAESLV
jgi:hypothetical protein